MPEPRLPLTVPMRLWQAVAEATYPAFADSYLSGADHIGQRITAHTTIAYDRMVRNHKVMAAFQVEDFALVKPLPFGHHDRPDSFMAAAS